MAQSQIDRAGNAKLIVELLAYIALTVFVLPVAAFVANFHLFGTTSEQRAEGFVWYWVVPIGFGAWLLFQALFRNRNATNVKVLLLVLAIINIAWPPALHFYQELVAKPAAYEQQVRVSETQRQEREEFDRSIQRDSELKQLAVQRGCGDKPGFNSQDYSYRINYYREKVTELRGEYVDFISTLTDLKVSYWESCARGTITSAQLPGKYASIADYIVTIYKQNYGTQKFNEFEAEFKRQQALRPDRQIY